MKIIAPVCLFSILLISCGERKETDDISSETVTKEAVVEGGSTLTVTEFDKLLNKTETAVLLDVRTPEEYTEGHLDGSVNINFNDTNFESTIDKQDKSLTYFVYCKKGGRGEKAATLMREKGFTVYNMEGGIETWSIAGKEVTKPSMTMAQYNNKINSAKYVMIDFTATWCGPCKRMKPVLDEIADELEKDDFIIVEVDVDKDAAVSEALQIFEMPTYFFYKKGKQVGRLKGEMPKNELTTYIKALMKI